MQWSQNSVVLQVAPNTQRMHGLDNSFQLELPPLSLSVVVLSTEEGGSKGSGLHRGNERWRQQRRRRRQASHLAVTA